MSDATRRNKLYFCLIGITLRCTIFISKNLKIIVVVVVCVRWACVANATERMWRSEDSSVGFDLSFHLHMGSEDQSQLCQACVASAFTLWTVSLAPENLVFKLYHFLFINPPNCGPSRKYLSVSCRVRYFNSSGWCLCMCPCRWCCGLNNPVECYHAVLYLGDRIRVQKEQHIHC